SRIRAREDRGKDPRGAGSTTGVPQNRGLQLGEEQAPLISLPDSRRPETAYASYSRRLPNAGQRHLQILGRKILHKCLNHRAKSVEFISRERLRRWVESARCKPPPGPAAVISVSPIRSRLAEAGTGYLGVGATPESLDLCVRCGGFGQIFLLRS